jgi:hypothetical protein
MTEKRNEHILSIEEFFKIATLEQKKLLSDIYEDVMKEVAITKKINAVYGSIENGIYFQDGGVAMCNSNDDADVISLRLKVELEDVRKDIGILMRKAADELHMGNVGMIQRQYGNYVK